MRFNVPLLPNVVQVRSRRLEALRVSLRGLMFVVAVMAVLFSLYVYFWRVTWTETKSGLKFRDTAIGAGPSPREGQTCIVNYTGWLWVDEAKGKKIDSSVAIGRPFAFPLGKKQVIARLERPSGRRFDKDGPWSWQAERILIGLFRKYNRLAYGANGSRTPPIRPRTQR